jgi:hypothetical protein
MTTYRNSVQNVHLLHLLRSMFELIGTNKSHINQTIRLWSLTFHSMTLFGNVILWKERLQSLVGSKFSLQAQSQESLKFNFTKQASQESIEFNFNEETSGIKQEWSLCVFKFALKPHITFNNIHSRQTYNWGKTCSRIGNYYHESKSGPQIKMVEKFACKDNNEWGYYTLLLSTAVSKVTHKDKHTNKKKLKPCLHWIKLMSFAFW